jgi:hypothetical protein
MHSDLIIVTNTPSDNSDNRLADEGQARRNNKNKVNERMDVFLMQ